VLRSKKGENKHQVIIIESNLARRLSVVPTCYTAPFAAGACGGVASIAHGISTTAAGTLGSAELSNSTSDRSDRQRKRPANPTFDNANNKKLIQQNMFLQQQKSQNEKHR
jgi:hypothetical protein